MAQHEILQLYFVVFLLFQLLPHHFYWLQLLLLITRRWWSAVRQAFACFSNWTGTGLTLSLSPSLSLTLKLAYKTPLAVWVNRFWELQNAFCSLLLCFFGPARLISNLPFDIRLFWAAIAFIGPTWLKLSECHCRRCCCSAFALFCVCGTFCTFYGARTGPTSSLPPKRIDQIWK